MINSMGITGDHEVLRIEDLDMHDDVRRQFEQQAEERRGSNPVSEQVAKYNSRETDIKLTHPSPAKNFCQQCGQTLSLSKEIAQPSPSASKPVVEPMPVARITAYGVTVEIQAGGNVVITKDAPFNISVREPRSI